MVLTVAEAAQKLGLSRQRVQQLIHAGRLKAHRHGLRALMVDAASIANFRKQPNGRPKKSRNISTKTIALN